MDIFLFVFKPLCVYLRESVAEQVYLISINISPIFIQDSDNKYIVVTMKFYCADENDTHETARHKHRLWMETN